MTSTRVDFSEISARYERDSHVQKASAEVLLGLLDVGPDEDVLDLGCGTGHLTRRIRAMTRGRVLGVDPAEGMIAQARGELADLRFERLAAEELPFRDAFDAVFCNSALQWFRDPPRAMAACHRALRSGGRIALQAPARLDYCPNFLQAVGDVSRDPEMGTTFARFRSPWFFLDSADAYADVLRSAGFSVPFARIEVARTRHPPDQAVQIFESGAAAGYLNPDCYDVPLSAGYVARFREIVRDSFRGQAVAGEVELVFNRVYLLGHKASS